LASVSSNRLLLACAFAGAGTMAIELSAVRLVAPWFGTSQAVWTSAIGAVLIAMAIGYLVGGKWAGSEAPERRLTLSLWFAAAWAAGLPSLAPWVASTLMPESASLEVVASILPLSSLACALVLFLPPAALLATAGPIVVELLARSRSLSAGRSGGQVLASSTLGSLLGTFGTTYLGIPILGVSGTLWLTASLIAVGALLCSSVIRHHQASVFAIGVFLVSSSGASSVPAGVLASVESQYQSVRIIERADGWRNLEVNERRGSFQSVWKPEAGLLGSGYYYDCFALPPHWAQATDEWSVLVLGLGSGTAWRVLEGSMPPSTQLHAMGVELDPVVVSLSREFMGLSADGDHRRTLAGWDARAALGPISKGGRAWDQLIVDVYANQVEIPPHLATVEFYAAAKSLLAEGGWLQVNVGASGLNDPLVSAVGATLATVFEKSTLALEVPFSRNVVLIQRRAAAYILPSSESFVPDQEGLNRLAQQLRIPGVWGLIEAEDGRVLIDGDAPLEALQRRSLAGMSEL
jgi:spermidine synthase